MFEVNSLDKFFSAFVKLKVDADWCILKWDQLNSSETLNKPQRHIDIFDLSATEHTTANNKAGAGAGVAVQCNSYIYNARPA